MLNYFLATTAAAAVTTAAMTLKSAAVFTAATMTGIPYVALPIPRFVRVEVAERLFSASWHRPTITVMRIVAVIYVTIEAVRTVEPRPGSNEQPTSEPVRTVVAIGRAVIRGIVEIPVWAIRGNADTNCDLGRCFRAAGD